MTRIGLTRNRLSPRNLVKHCEDGESNVKPGNRSLSLILLFAIQIIVTQSAMAQTRSGAVTIRFTTLSPFIALLAGILILIMPRLLNYIVAIYLILVGLIGVLGV